MTPRADAFARRMGISHPIIAAPMANAGGVELAVAAIGAGALGSLPCAMLAGDEIVAQVAQVRAAAAGPLNLNFFCHDMPEDEDDSAWRAALAPYYAAYGVAAPTTPQRLRQPFSAAQCDAVEVVRPAVVSFHFGLPGPALLTRVRASGAAILATATTVREARWLAEQGVDAVIAQGAEAGGHAGSFLDGDPATHQGLMALLPQIVDAIDLPVIAAGGISDGRSMAAALMLGASAVQFGTALLATPQCPISPLYRAALASEAARHSQFTTLLSGRPARTIPNRLLRELGPFNPAVPPFPLASAALMPLRAAAEAVGDTSFSFFLAGAAAPLGRAVDAAALIAALADEAKALLPAQSCEVT